MCAAHRYIRVIFMTKTKWKLLILCIALPLAVGALSAFLTRGGMSDFDRVLQPPLAPPAWLFPVVWTILYTLMGISSYLVLTSGDPSKYALLLYFVQLILNFFWSLIFFGLQNYLFAFVWLVALWAAILGTIFLFSRSSKTAALLMIPYLLWVTFAGYLNFGIYLLNR